MSKDELVALIKKNPISVGCGVLALALGVGLYFRADAIPEAEAERDQKTAEADRLTINVKNSEKLKEQLEELAAAGKTIESRMVRVNQLGTNTQYFYKIFADTGVKPVDSPRQNTTAANMPKGGKTAFISVSFSLSVQGSMSQILDFLRQLESGTHYCRVMSATLSSGGAVRSGPLTLSLNLELLGLP